MKLRMKRILLRKQLKIKLKIAETTFEMKLAMIKIFEDFENLQC